MAVSLPEYDVAFENEAYVRDRSVSADGEFVVVKDIILPVRYTQPSENDVVAHLREKAKALGGAGAIVLTDGRRVMTDRRSALERAIINLPEKIRRDISEGDEECLKFIRVNTDAPALKEGELPRGYVNIKYGVLPTNLVDENKVKGNVSSSRWFLAALNDDDVREAGFGIKFNINILLNGGRLPDKDEIDILMKHGVYSSRTFDVNRPYPLDRMQEIIDAVYQGMPRAEDIEQLRDASEGVLEESSLSPIIALHTMVRKKVEQAKSQEDEMRRIAKNGRFHGSNGSS